MIEPQEQACVLEDMAFQRVIIEEMGELLPTELLAECDLSRARSVLEIGCGGGEWLCALARRYPDLQCIGIDQDELLVKTANALASRDGLAQVAFLAHEIDGIPSTLFPQRSFDLVHLNFLGRYILKVDYPALAQMCAAFFRPGGMVCWSEAELPITTSAAFERLTSLVCGSAQKEGLQKKRGTPKVKGNENLLNHQRSILSCMYKYRSHLN